MRLHVDQVIVGRRLRGLTEAKVEALMVSYQETEDLPPIITRPLFMVKDRVTVELVAGLHRLEACRRLGIPVDCMVRPMSDHQARLVECDENLLGPDLTPLDRAVFLDARLQAWAGRYPDRVKADGAPKRGRPRKSESLSAFPPTMGFAADVAAEIGLTDRSIRNALTIFRGLTPATREGAAGTWLARNEGALRQMAAIADPADQAATLQVLLDGRTKSVADAQVIAAGGAPVKAAKSASDEALEGFKKGWKAASETQRGALLEWLQGQALPEGWEISRG